MIKKTVLDDDAEIYKLRKVMTEKEKLHSMNFKQKLEYLWEYYKIHAMIGILAIAIVVYIIHAIITPNVKTELYAAMINNPIKEPQLTQMQKEAKSYLKLKPKIQDILFNTNYLFDSSSNNSAEMKTVLTTHIAAQEVDVIIAPKSIFKTYAYHGFFDKLSDQLPTDLYSSLTDQFYLSSDQDHKEKSDYGIYLTDSDYYKNANQKDPYLIGIVSNSKHKTNSIEFIRFLFQSLIKKQAE